MSFGFGRAGVTKILLDTHVFAWALQGRHRISSVAAAAIVRSDSLVLSVVSLFEVGQKVRIGKWPDMEPFTEALVETAGELGIRLVSLSASISLDAARLDWLHRDPFDRMVAATALAEDATLVSADPVFDVLPLRRIW
jgi:PIN domain nuclease of toxin-antitoxin system